MAVASAMVPCAPHGSNKISRNAWWNFSDLLHKRIVDLAMEFLCAKWRVLPYDSKQALQNLYGSSWLAASCYTVWMDARVLLEPQRRSAYIKHTYAIDADFAGAMVNNAYVAQMGKPASLVNTYSLQCMD